MRPDADERDYKVSAPLARTFLDGGELNDTPDGTPLPPIEIKGQPIKAETVEANVANASSIFRDMALKETSRSRPDSNPKSAFGIKKPSMHLIPGIALLYLAKVMALGAFKYGAFNWREQPVAATVYLDAAYRHILAWLDGEDNDPESGAPHIAHAMACFAILLDAKAHGTLIDDRPKGGQISSLMAELTVKD